MALVDIARQLKETYEGFNVSEHQDELKHYRELYGDAECIRIGEMDYIVINGVYKSREYDNVPENISPLFFNSINNSYAIIDAETSSTLIDEVYSRVTYMQRVCRIDSLPDDEIISSEIRRTLAGLIGTGEILENIHIKADDGSTDRKANIFQCQLIKDTGVSASPDVYSFMMKNGEIKEIADHVMRQIRRSGEVNLFRNNNEIEELERNRFAIQQAVFDKYINSDLDIQNITVKSIFEISMTFLNINLMFKNSSNHLGVYNTVYLASENNEFEALNANIHVCNECGHELVDVKDSNNIHRLHINIDALDPALDTDAQHVYAVGCEDCLVQCPDCGEWHFNYEKFIGSRIYEKLKLAPGRSFIRGLRTIDSNYCKCREGIEWVYDERSGDEAEHDIIPIEKMAFINYANEKIASYEDFVAYCEKKKSKKSVSAAEESRIAKQLCADFKKQLANKLDIDVKDISISSADKCNTCTVCGGGYYKGTIVAEDDTMFRCDICDELISEGSKSVTRMDGVVFMCRRTRSGKVISKYIVTKFGNLKEISSSLYSVNDTENEETDEITAAEDTPEELE